MLAIYLFHSSFQAGWVDHEIFDETNCRYMNVRDITDHFELYCAGSEL